MNGLRAPSALLCLAAVLAVLTVTPRVAAEVPSPAGAEPPSAADIELALAVAGELERATAFDAARRQLEAVAALVRVELAEDLRMRACATWLRQEQAVTCRRCYLELAAGLVDAERQALAAHHAATVMLQLDAETAREELERLVDTAPGTDAARRAVAFLRSARRERGGAAAEADYLIGVASRLAARHAGGRSCATLPPRTRDLCAGALVAAGRIRLEERGLAESAGRLLLAAEQAAGSGVWLDDAQLWRARALRASGQLAESASTYRRLVEARQSSWWVGSYESEHHDVALLELGETLEQAGRLEEAREAYLGLVDDAPGSRLADDAAFAAARIAAARGATAELDDFIDAYPASRHQAEARRLLERP